VVHLLLPGEWTISADHKLADQIENQVRDTIPNSNIVTHTEPANDPLSLQDASLDYAGVEIP
jgi:divalent metal cation (Fe/Co/Zn/Cd) transporter